MGTILHPVHPRLVIISICLFHQQLYSFKKEEDENAQWQKSCLMWGPSVCHNSLGHPVNLWATGTVGQFVLSHHCMKFVSVVSPVSLSLWAEMSSSSDECVSESNFNTSSVMSQSVRFLYVAILLNTLWPDSADTKPNTFWLTDSNVSSAWPVASCCTERDQLKCSVVVGH